MPLRTGGRLPGPLDFHAIFLADVAATKAAKAAAAVPTLAMPTPYGDMTKYARVVAWPLYGGSGPQTTDISQGGLGDCPLPALLAAMANIGSGQKKIVDMIVEHKDKVITDLSKLKGSLSGE